MQLRIGIYVTGNWEQLHSTIASLADTGVEKEILILVDSSTPIPIDLPASIRDFITVSNRIQGEAGAFNAFLASGSAEAYLWLENGTIADSGAIETLWHALHNSDAGMAGPSTNQCWNEQGIARDLPGSATGFDQRAAAAWRNQYSNQIQVLSPLYSLNCFCLMLTAHTVSVVGAADEKFANQPCWEMDYNVRAARAGISGIWVKAALVYRNDHQFTSPDSSLVELAKRTYQDKHCALQKNDNQPYHEHCKGDDCQFFATDTTINIPFDCQPDIETNNDSTESEHCAAKAIVPPPSERIEIIASPNVAITDEVVPLVSCILPTCDRSQYLPMAIALFLKQDYEGAELVIVDDGNEPAEALIPDHPRIKYFYLKGEVSLGEKRNICCDLARGQIILHWDDDDWFAYWRISYQVAHLLNSGKMICGVDRMYYADPLARRAWIYAYPEKFGTWVAGGSFCYQKALWQQTPFAAVNDGEDTQFINKINDSDVLVLERYDFYVGRVHAGNTSVKKTNEVLWHDLAFSTIELIIDSDFEAWAK